MSLLSRRSLMAMEDGEMEKEWKLLTRITLEEDSQLQTIDISEHGAKELMCIVYTKLTEDSASSGNYLQLYADEIRLYETNNVYSNNWRTNIVEATIVDENLLKTLSSQLCIIEYSTSVGMAQSAIGLLRNSGKEVFEILTLQILRNTGKMEKGTEILVYGR